MNAAPSPIVSDLMRKATRSNGKRLLTAQMAETMAHEQASVTAQPVVLHSWSDVAPTVMTKALAAAKRGVRPGHLFTRALRAKRGQLRDIAWLHLLITLEQVAASPAAAPRVRASRAAFRHQRRHG